MSLIIYKQTANLYALVRDSASTDRERYSLVTNALKVNIQPAGLEYTATQPDGAIGKLFRAFTTFSGCQIGMRIQGTEGVTTSGLWFDIVGVEGFLGPAGKHWELLVRKSTN